MTEGNRASRLENFLCEMLRKRTGRDADTEQEDPKRPQR